MKEKMKRLLKYIIAYFIMITIFIVFLTLVSLIPRDSIEKNVEKSSEVLTEQTNRWYIKIRDVEIMFDNFTDALMINTAYSIDANKPFESFMLARKNYLPEIVQRVYKDETGELRSASKYESLDQVGELKDTVNKDIDETFEYARYWHGYLVWLRPALIFMDINMIRNIMQIVLPFLAIVLISIIAKRIHAIYALSIGFGFFAVDYLYIGLSLQNVSLYLVTIVFSIIIAIKGEKIKNIYLLFFIIGGIVCFVDFLTAPIISLGLPLIIYFLELQNTRNLTCKEILKTIFFACALWVMGYALIWITKWVLVDIIYNRELVQTAIKQVMFRTDNSEHSFLLNTVCMLFLIRIYVYICVCLIIAFLVSIANRFIYKEKFEKIKNRLLTTLPYVIIFLMPFVWMFVLRDHTFKHMCFTYRILLLSVTTVPIILFKFIIYDDTEVEKYKEKG